MQTSDDKSPLQRTPTASPTTTTTSNNTNETIDNIPTIAITDPSDESADSSLTNNSGQAALNRLLASLALESDLIERCCATTPPNSATANDNVFTFPAVPAAATRAAAAPLRVSNAHNSSISSSCTSASSTSAASSTTSSPQSTASDLDDVIASLTDFARQHDAETVAAGAAVVTTVSGICLSGSMKSPIGGVCRLPAAVRRLNGSGESENSSSVSPSLSDRSNGLVSWSDQVDVCINLPSPLCCIVPPPKPPTWARPFPFLLQYQRWIVRGKRQQLKTKHYSCFILTRNSHSFHSSHLFDVSTKYIILVRLRLS